MVHHAARMKMAPLANASQYRNTSESYRYQKRSEIRERNPGNRHPRNSCRAGTVPRALNL
jgi:hypothetical protein